MAKTTSVLLRFILLCLSLSSVICVFALAIGAQQRLIGIFVLVLFLLMLLTMLLLEPIFARILRASGAAEKVGGASNSAAWITIQHSGPGLNLPILLSFADPIPDALVVRSLFGRGKILLSQGILATLNEADLRSVLAYCMKRCNDSELPFQSFCALLSFLILKLAPQRTLRAFIHGERAKRLGPVALTCFFIALGPARLIARLGGRWEKRYDDNPTLSDAMQKISKTVLFCGVSSKPFGTECLALAPNSHLQLVSIS